MRRLWVLALVLVACGHGESPDKTGLDAMDNFDGGFFPDAADPCRGGFTFLTGELIDWDSDVNNNKFLGIFQAQLFVPGQQMPIESTPPNGRLDTCVPTSDPIVLDVDNPGDYLDAKVIVAQDALQGFVPISLRAMTKTRAASFYQERGLVFDGAKAQVVVFFAGDRAQVTLDRAHGVAQSGNDDAMPGTFTWTQGDTGRYVLLPNVDVAQPTGTINSADGPHTIPLVAGQLTLVAIGFVFI